VSLALLAAGLLLVSAGTGVWARRALSRLELKAGVNRRRVFPEEGLELKIELYNRKLLPVWAEVEIAFSPSLLEQKEKNPEGSASAPFSALLCSRLRLLSWEKAGLAIKLSAKKRGLAVLGPASISAGDLLGLCLRAKKTGVSQEIAVFPRRLELKNIELPFQEYFGVHPAAAPVEDPVWYAGTRDYTGSRPAKNIHWKASARLGVLQEKIYEPSLRRKVLFIFDAAGFSSHEEEEFERMLEILGSLAALLAESGASFGFVTNSGLPNGKPGILPPGRGLEHLGNLLESLAGIKFGRYTELLPLFREASPAYTGCVYCAASPGETAREIIRYGCGDSSGSGKFFCVFSRPGPAETIPEKEDGRGLFLWEGFPACLGREAVDEG
jgi:uncharacterized protein (DUF58 family)